MPAEAPRAAIYCRVSTEDQVDNTSLAEQLARCRATAAARGWQVVEEYVEEAVSGGDHSRPKLDRLRAQVSDGEVDVVVAAKLDRFSRSLLHLAACLDEFERREVIFVSAIEGVDTSTPAGKLVLTVLAVIAEMERKMIAERTQSGTRARVRAGGWVGGDKPPYGYRVVGRGREARLEVDPDEQHLIETAVSLLLDEQMTSGQAARRLNALGLTPRNAPLWSSQNLRNMIARGQFDGSWTFAKPAKRTKTYEPITVQVPPVLPSERVQAVRAYLAATRLVRSAGETHPLSGRLVCQCGAHMTGLARSDRANRRYRCRFGRHEPGRRFCDEPSLLADRVDAAVWSEIVTLLSYPELLRRAAQDRVQRLAADAGSEGLSLDDVRRRKARAQGALADAVTKCLALGLDQETTQRTIAGLQAAYDAAVEAEQYLIAQALRTQEAADKAAVVARLAEVAAEQLLTADRELQAKVLALLDVTVTVTSNSREQKGPVMLAVTGSIGYQSLLDSAGDWHLPGWARGAG